MFQAIKPYDLSCLIATLFFLLTNLIGFILYALYRTRSSFNWDDFTQLQPSYIQTEFQFRRDHSTMKLFYNIMNALTWFVLIIPLLKVTWILSCRGTHFVGIHITMVILLLGGSFCELVANLLEIGTFTACIWLGGTGTFNLSNWVTSANGEPDDIGWRVLQMISIVTSAMMLWIDSIEYLFLSGVFIMIYYSIYKTNRSNYNALEAFSMKWALYGVIIGGLCSIVFVADLLRYNAWGFFGGIAFTVSLITKFVLIPVWLIWLAIQLPKAEAIILGYEASNNNMDTVTSSNKPENDHSYTTPNGDNELNITSVSEVEDEHSLT